MSAPSAPTPALPSVLLRPLPPVRHPADLPTTDPSLATELMPAPPPLAVVRGESHKALPKAVRYLPAFDAGTTYTGHGAVPRGLESVLGPPVAGANGGGVAGEGTEKRKTRGDGPIGPSTNAVNRVRTTRSTQVASSSPAAGTSSPAPPPPASSTPVPAQQQPPASSEADPSGERPSKRPKIDRKGKGKETSESAEPPMVNKDYCEACGGTGDVLCCDGCTRSFHFICLDPPVESRDLPEGSWFCNACTYKKKPPPKLPRTPLAPLIRYVEGGSPKVYKLPDNIREYFKNVATGPYGEYVQQGNTRGGRLNKWGALEERDPFRLKDKNGKVILCYACKGSAMPDEPSAPPPAPSAAARPTRSQSNGALSTQTTAKRIISCDYCPEHWHYDCLDPPLLKMPANSVKWQCPLHVEHVFPQKRVPKHGVKTVDVSEPGRRNNGIIEVVYPDDDLASMRVDQLVINNKRYRIPEKVIVLDFWETISGQRDPTKRAASSMPATSLAPSQPSDSVPRRLSRAFSSLSPLTSLSSLTSIPDSEFLDDPSADFLSIGPPAHPVPSTPPRPPMPQTADGRDVMAAQILASLQNAPISHTAQSSAGLGIKFAPEAAHNEPNGPNVQMKMEMSSPVPSALGLTGLPESETQRVLSAAREQLKKNLGTASTETSPKSPRVIAKSPKPPLQQLRKDIYAALGHTPPSSPKLGSRSGSPKPSHPASPKSGIVVTQKGESFTLRFNANQPALKRHSSSSAVPQQSPPSSARKSTNEDISIAPSAEELEKLRAVRRLMMTKGEAELMRFLNS